MWRKLNNSAIKHNQNRSKLDHLLVSEEAVRFWPSLVFVPQQELRNPKTDQCFIKPRFLPVSSISSWSSRIFAWTLWSREQPAQTINNTHRSQGTIQKTDQYSYKHLTCDVNVLMEKVNILPFLVKTQETSQSVNWGGLLAMRADDIWSGYTE